jgi:hypothetical protein
MRYFPQAIAVFAARQPRGFVLDGELLICIGSSFSFFSFVFRSFPSSEEQNHSVESFNLALGCGSNTGPRKQFRPACRRGGEHQPAS